MYYSKDLTIAVKNSESVQTHWVDKVFLLLKTCFSTPVCFFFVAREAEKLTLHFRWRRAITYDSKNA